LDSCELLGGVRCGEQAVLDASALPVRPVRYGGVGDAIAAAMARRMLSMGVMLKAESFLLLRSSIDATVFVRVFEQVVR